MNLQASRVLPIILMLLTLAVPAGATNGDNLIAIGPIARSMGGVGIANPRDAISAVFANPAAMCFGPYCPSSEVNFAGTAFMPHIKANISRPGQSVSSDSDEKVYPIPAFGISVPISREAPYWRLGLAAYGVTGLGVDYRDTSLEKAGIATPGGTFPLAAGTYTNLQIMKFAPSIAVQPWEQISLGMAVHVDYAVLDLDNGSSAGYSAGLQLGAIYKPLDNVAIGLNYITPQNVQHNNVADFDQDGSDDNLDLESPQQLGLGVSYTTDDEFFMIETDVKWINWANAKGYDDFDWEDQWVFALGIQVKPISDLSLRAGYNYAKSPVKKNSDFNGAEIVSVQGKNMPRYYYEAFRIVGFPAIVEHHLTCGVGYQFTDAFSADVGYVHGFENTLSETGTNFLGEPTTIESSLSEDSVDFGVTWRF